jgi:hypothetical protein
MEIEYLSFLTNYQSNKTNSLIGISLVKIEQLEMLYNNGNTFPKTLRELLFVGGDSFHLLNRIWYKTQREIQTAAREWLMEFNSTIKKLFL